MKDFLCKPLQPLQQSVLYLTCLVCMACEHNGLRCFCPMFLLNILQ